MRIASIARCQSAPRCSAPFPSGRAPPPVDVATAQRDQLRHPQPGAVKELQHRPVAQPAGVASGWATMASASAGSAARAACGRAAAAALRCPRPPAPLAGPILEKGAHGCQPPAHSGRGQPPIAEREGVLVEDRTSTVSGSACSTNSPRSTRSRRYASMVWGDAPRSSCRLLRKSASLRSMSSWHRTFRRVRRNPSRHTAGAAGARAFYDRPVRERAKTGMVLAVVAALAIAVAVDATRGPGDEPPAPQAGR